MLFCTDIIKKKKYYLYVFHSVVLSKETLKVPSTTVEGRNKMIESKDCMFTLFFLYNSSRAALSRSLD